MKKFVLRKEVEVTKEEFKANRLYLIEIYKRDLKKAKETLIRKEKSIQANIDRLEKEIKDL